VLAVVPALPDLRGLAPAIVAASALAGVGCAWLAVRARDLDRLAWCATCALGAGGLLVVAAARLPVWKADPGATVADGRSFAGTVLRSTAAPPGMARWVIVRGNDAGFRRGDALERPR
jgi:hypothetical protein